ncbi:MAG: hypothetical protein B0A82_11180 [Alkalinema sp. CACIAM 70d]|nr:MAG: hypothetical protein B0A82_11180 [Alkalinema sp. CACIAM 70d]
MTKLTKPLKDIRYYECSGVPGPGKAMPSSSTELAGIPRTAHRIGQRIACMLHAEDFSVGTYDHIYIAFSPALPDGRVVPTDFGLEWWQRYVAYGIPTDFKSLTDDQKNRRIQSATFEVLNALRPDEKQLLESLHERLGNYGERTRILRAIKDTKAYRFEVWFDVPPWREPAYLYVVARENSSGQVLEAPPLLLKDYEDAFPLVSTISFTKGILNLNPRKSFRAGLSVNSYPTPIQIPLSEFAAQPIIPPDLAHKAAQGR